MARAFSTWNAWSKRESIGDDLKRPGIYAVAKTSSDIAGSPFSWRAEIIYIGMTNSKGGLRSRLKQFDNTIRGKDGHGGAHRVRFGFRQVEYEQLQRELYVSVCAFACDVKSNAPKDLRTMGEVAMHEYECWAKFVEAFGKLPAFNDKANAPKK